MYLSKSPHEKVDAISRATYDVFFDEYASVIFGLISITPFCDKEKKEIFAKVVQELWSERCRTLANEKLCNLAVIKVIAKIAFQERFAKELSINNLNNPQDRLHWAKNFINQMMSKRNELDNSIDKIA